MSITLRGPRGVEAPAAAQGEVPTLKILPEGAGQAPTLVTTTEPARHDSHADVDRTAGRAGCHPLTGQSWLLSYGCAAHCPLVRISKFYVGAGLFAALGLQICTAHSLSFGSSGRWLGDGDDPEVGDASGLPPRGAEMLCHWRQLMGHQHRRSQLSATLASTGGRVDLDWFGVMSSCYLVLQRGERERRGYPVAIADAFPPAVGLEA